MFQKITLTLGILVLSGFSIYKLSDIGKVNATAPCIITISGVQYDVSPLTATGIHPGGNVFVCGTDMTTSFMSIPTHAADIARMTPYLYLSPTAAPSATPTPTVSPAVTPTVTPSTSPTVSPSVSPTVSPSTFPKHDDDSDDNEQHESQNHDRGHSESHRQDESHHSSEHKSNLSIKAGSREHHEDK